MRLSLLQPSALVNRQPAVRDASAALPRPDQWEMKTTTREWSSEHDLKTYRRTFANIGAACGGFLSHFAALGAGAMLGASIGGAVGLGIAGTVALGAAGAAAGAKLQGTTLWGRSLLSKAGALAGDVTARLAHLVGLPLRSDLVETATHFNIKSLNQYGADMAYSGHPGVPEADAKAFIAKLQPGDIILTGDERSTPFATVTHLVTGRSDFTHAILYQGDNKTIEAKMATGVIEGDLKEVLTGKHHAVAIRPDYQAGQADQVMEAGRQQLGRPYDFKFKEGNDNFYCSESVYAAMKKGAPQIEFKTHHLLGRQLVIPNDLFYTQNAGVVGEVGVGRSYLDRLMGKYIKSVESQGEGGEPR